ncbi:MAG: ATP-binding protein [Bacillota bacterium]|nr:ATP-binding protein [Bacillota bacterium]
MKDLSEEVCALCGGTGLIVRHNDFGQDIMSFCRCREVEVSKNIWTASGINPSNSNLSFSSYKAYNSITMKAKNAAAKYYMEFNNIKNTKANSIAFLGQVGSGKTHLSLALGINLLNKGIAAVYMPYRDVITKLKQNIMDEEYYNSTLSKYKHAKVLIIDDLYKGKITESDINIMFEIINYRYLNCLPIIISSECVSEKLLDFDEGVGSRLLEMCKDRIVEIKGSENNYRLKNIL